QRPAEKRRKLGRGQPRFLRRRALDEGGGAARVRERSAVEVAAAGKLDGQQGVLNLQHVGVKPFVDRQGGRAPAEGALDHRADVDGAFGRARGRDKGPRKRLELRAVGQRRQIGNE